MYNIFFGRPLFETRFSAKGLVKKTAILFFFMPQNDIM